VSGGDGLRVGSVELENPFVLAPMAGISDPPFRRLCRGSGAGLVCAEMVSANALHFGDERSLKMLEVFPDEHPVSMQIFGGEPERLAAAARRAADAGADIVDLNCGCPVPKITSGGAGMSLMNDEGLFARCLEAMVKAVRVPVTVKMRLGRKAGENRALRFARLAESVGVAAVSVHARSQEARHSGPPDIEALREVVSEVKIPVFGNGGVRTLADAEAMMRATGCAGVMVGQAAVGNPTIFSGFLEQAGGSPARSFAERVELLMRHARMNTDYFGERMGVLRLRKCMASYIQGVPNASELRNRAYGASSVGDLERIFADFSAVPAA
jgi:tRNA-dihydrouridine synthase B